MSNGMKMFPDSFEEFIEQYQTKEPKFGDYYVPATKVRQALEHYASASNEKGITLKEALDLDPTAVMTLAVQEVISNATNLVMRSVHDSCNQTVTSCEKIVDRAIQKLEDSSNHPEEQDLSVLYSGLAYTDEERSNYGMG